MSQKSDYASIQASPLEEGVTTTLLTKTTTTTTTIATGPNVVSSLSTAVPQPPTVTVPTPRRSKVLSWLRTPLGAVVLGSLLGLVVMAYVARRDQLNPFSSDAHAHTNAPSSMMVRNNKNGKTSNNNNNDDDESNILYRPYCEYYNDASSPQIIQTSMKEPSQHWSPQACILKPPDNLGYQLLNYKASARLNAYAAPDAILKVNFSQRAHAERPDLPIVGFGGAFTEAAALNYQQLSQTGKDTLMELLFGSSGLGYTVGRIPIGACDFSIDPYNFDNVEDDFNMTHFDGSVTHDVEVGMVDMALRATSMVRQAWSSGDENNNNVYQQDGRMLLFASPWSPPSWMKQPTQDDAPDAVHAENMTGSTEPTCLREGTGPESRYAQAYALYLSRFVQAYQDVGLPLWALTVQNEPEFPAPWEACAYTPQEQARFLQYHLGPILRQEHPDLKILIFDHNKDHVNVWAHTLLGDTAETSSRRILKKKKKSKKDTKNDDTDDKPPKEETDDKVYDDDKPEEEETKKDDKSSKEETKEVEPKDDKSNKGEEQDTEKDKSKEEGKGHEEVELDKDNEPKEKSEEEGKDVKNEEKEYKSPAHYVDGIAYHWYAGGMDRLLDGALGAVNLHRLQDDLHKYKVQHSTLVLGSESCHCPSTGYAGGSLEIYWSRAERYAHTILSDLAAGSNGWVDWNLLLDSIGGPNHLGNLCDAPILAVPHRARGAGEEVALLPPFELHDPIGGVIIGDGRTREELNALGFPARYIDVGLAVQPMYYYMGHMSRYVRPGSYAVMGLVRAAQGHGKIFQPKGSVVMGGGMNDLARNGIELTVWPCEGSTRQQFHWNFEPMQPIQVLGHDWLGNPTVSCLAREIDPDMFGLRFVGCEEEEDDESGTLKAGIFNLIPLVDQEVGTYNIYVTNPAGKKRDRCLVIRDLHNEGGAYGPQGGAQVTLGSCTDVSAKWYIDQDTGEASSRYFRDHNGKNEVCMTTGWPFLQMGAFLTPHGEAPKTVVILNEANDGANYVLNDENNNVLSGHIPPRTIQTVLLQ
jgi:O-glycosyl hydrolase